MKKHNKKHKDKEVRMLSKRRIRRNLKNIDTNFISRATNKKMSYWENFYD